MGIWHTCGCQHCLCCCFARILLPLCQWGFEVSEVIRDKKRMYELLAAGRLGNTCPQWFSVQDWMLDDRTEKYEWWGVRTLTPAGPYSASLCSIGSKT